MKVIVEKIKEKEACKSFPDVLFVRVWFVNIMPGFGSRGNASNKFYHIASIYTS